MKVFALVLIAAIAAVTVSATEKDDVALIEFDAHIPNPLLPEARPNLLRDEGNSSDIDWEKVIKIGKEIWQIIEDNQPVLNYSTWSAGAVPPVEDWLQMGGWKDQYWQGFQWSWKNIYQMTTINFEWAFSFRCNGNYQGKGRYVNAATVAIKAIHVAWPQQVNIVATSMSPANYGTVEDPIGGLDLEITMEVSNVLQKEVQKCRVAVKGDCSAKIVACDGYY